jgi:hypothetical protein
MTSEVKMADKCPKKRLKYQGLAQRQVTTMSLSLINACGNVAAIGEIRNNYRILINESR